MSNDRRNILNRIFSIFSNNSGVNNSSNNLFYGYLISNRNSLNDSLGNIMSNNIISCASLNLTKGLTNGYTHLQSLIHHLDTRLSSSQCTS